MIHRAIKVKNQVGEAIVDESNKTVLIYVTEEQKLDEIQIDSMELGGSKATVVPSPQTVTNFFLTSSLQKPLFYNYLINRIL